MSEPIRSTREAVRLCERACGTLWFEDPAAAAGASLAGLRAAAPYGGRLEARRRRLPLVLHLEGPSAGALHADVPLRFVAGDAQEAVDLTLVARRVAEAALVPALVAFDGDGAAPVEVELPPPELVAAFLGASGDTVHAATAEQELLFGRHRRRVPRWHDLGRPLLCGAEQGPEVLALADAAQHTYVDVHLPELVESALAELQRRSGRPRDAVSVHGMEGARRVWVATGAAVGILEAAADRLRADAGLPVGVLGLKVLRPFPAMAVVEHLRGRHGVEVFEGAVGADPEGPLTRQIRATFEWARGLKSGAEPRGLLQRALPRLGGARRQETSEGSDLPALGESETPVVTAVFYGAGSSSPDPADLDVLGRRLAGGGGGHGSPIHLGVGFRAGDDAPKRRALADALARAYPRAASTGVRAERPVPAGGGRDEEVPAAVRRHARGDAPLSSLARFSDQVGDVYRRSVAARPAAGRGAAGELFPDPVLTTATLPAASAALRASPAAVDAMLPVFDPALCTACGDCWTSCPDGAVAPLVVSPRNLLEQGMELARAAGGVSPDGLRPVLRKLVPAIHRELRASSARSAGRLVESALGGVLDKLPEERRGAVRDAWGTVRSAIGELPVARTAVHFDGPEAERPESGGLFAIAIDPDACRSCGLCVAACEPEALASRAGDADRRQRARALWALCDRLPEPDDEAVVKTHTHADAGPLAAALMPRAHREIVLGRDPGEDGSGARLAVRQVLGAMAAGLEPGRRQRRLELAALRAELGQAIRDHLAGALPGDDLEALARGLDAFDRPEAELSQLTARVERSFGSPRVDVARLRRLVTSARELAGLAGATDGDGAGRPVATRPVAARAAFGVLWVPGPATAWASTFPDNPLTVPAATASAAEAAGLARGLCEGQVRAALEELATVSRARALLAGGGDQQALRWEDLDDDQRRLCPPLVVIAGEGSFAERPADLSALLTGDLPIKVLLLAEETPGGGTGGARTVDPVALGLVTGVPVVQTSIAFGDHLAGGVAFLLDRPGPALLRVHAPSPERQGFAPEATLEESRRAVASRAFPLFRLASEAGGLPDLDLDGNPEPAAAFAGGHVPAWWSLLRRTPAVEAAEGPTAAPAPELPAAAAPPPAADPAELRSRLEAELHDRLRQRLLMLARPPATASPAPASPDEGTSR